MEAGCFYFWHPGTDKEAKTLPDLTWVNADPALLPRPEGQPYQQMSAGQYLYIYDFKPRSTQCWWRGYLLSGKSLNGLIVRRGDSY